MAKSTPGLPAKFTTHGLSKHLLSRYLCHVGNLPVCAEYMGECKDLHPAYDKGEHDNENTMLLKEYHFREMTVNLETIGEEYR
jgi:hypothetical protein